MVLVEVDGPADELTFASAADVTVTWAHRQGAEANGDYYAWVACESLTAKALRAHLIADHSANPKWMRAAGYCAARSPCTTRTTTRPFRVELEMFRSDALEPSVNLVHVPLRWNRDTL